MCNVTFAAEDGSTLEMEESDSAEIGILRVRIGLPWLPLHGYHIDHECVESMIVLC